ncbi:pyrroline-5-carboxylate reductase [Ligilactobacillus ceti]|uniref:Pyrroline-5-carboxylate reductase n=1 Tax=Ligilactobacillus ceti DSM 22408 TaxID=1122146 RepID=A0A0R2KI56_9LACO|nr:pyrroline-5-carboxylate reductase [Ligilactobacillus ceti]KRN89056.1 pyrroline-5-carboxylate reductase [Ligilactobacillus ceti DSM 22408]
MKIGFIGVGNMSSAIIKGLLAVDFVKPADIYVHSGTKSKYEAFAKEYGLTTCESNSEVVQSADYVMLGIKPYILTDILKEIKETVRQENVILISMVTGISLAEMQADLENDDAKIVRIMPNVNVEINEGMTALKPNKAVKESEFQDTVDIFTALGQVIELPEKDFSIFVALAGSSPAFIYFFIDSLARAGVKYGLTKKQADQIVAQAVLGSAKKVLTTDKTPFELVDDVCSPGGTTIAGLLALEEAGFMTSVVKAVDATVQKDQNK